MITHIHAHRANKTDKKKTVHIKCLVLPLRTDKIGLILVATQWMYLQAFWFDVRGKGETIGTKPLIIGPGSVLYFIASPYTMQGCPEYRYFYVLQYNDDQERFACSCSKGWNFKQTQVDCEHMQFLSEQRQKTLACCDGT